MRLFLTMIFALLSPMLMADTLRLAVTTSFHNSGLSEVLLPAIKRDTGVQVDLLVVGTGQALALGAAGDVDAVLVHAKAAELTWITQGHGPYRREIMYNDFVIVGPAVLPNDLNAALSQIVGKPFVSRGDDSGTHKAEQMLWAQAGITPDGAWYREVGAGMGAALNTAVGLGAYVLTDRASWLNFGNKQDLDIVFQNDPALFNQYSFLPVSDLRHTHVNRNGAQQLEDWLVGDAGQALIASYRLDDQQLFFPNADK